MKKCRAVTLNTKIRSGFDFKRSLRLIAILMVVFISLNLFAGCRGSDSVVTETIFQADAADRSAGITETAVNKSESTSIRQPKTELQPPQISTAATTTVKESDPGTALGTKEEVSPAKKAPVPDETIPVETTVRPVETTAKPVETTVKPVETTVKPVETTVKPVVPTVKSNPAYVAMTSQEAAVADQLLVLLNNYRAEKGLAPVAASAGYIKAASARAREASVLFQHTRPDGSDFYTVLNDFGMPFVACGENLAMRSGGISSETAQLLLNQWIQSSGHNENMLNAKWKYAGIGVCLAEDGQSVYASQFFAAG